MLSVYAIFFLRLQDTVLASGIGGFGEVRVAFVDLAAGELAFVEEKVPRQEATISFTGLLTDATAIHFFKVVIRVSFLFCFSVFVCVWLLFNNYY